MNMNTYIFNTIARQPGKDYCYTHVDLCSTGMHRFVQLTGAVLPGKILL